jgi:hypothetical protein
MSFLRWLMGKDDKIHSHRLLEAEVIAQAEGVAAEQGWTWQEPARARARLRQGRHVWVVESHAGSGGENVRVVIDDGNGAVVDKRLLNATG